MFNKSLVEGIERIERAIHKLEVIMGQGLTDLNTQLERLQADLTALQTTVASAVTDLQNLSAASDPDSAVEAIAQSLSTVATGLESASSSLGAAVTAAGGTATAPAPAPAPT